ncbi:MAG TPA: ubiquitin-conjugating enzyme E2 [Methylomirabilota bacterium]|nr:ubiquitin-conjugating enzyme E2 [Methylomirabilota bacterium]
MIEVLGKETGPDGDSFWLLLHGTSGVVEVDGRKALVSSHQIEIRFPRFFPYVPMEARLGRPVFHPNVDPTNGFVCLWNRFAVEDTVVTGLHQLQRVISWELINQDPRHIIQPAAVEWYKTSPREWSLPLSYAAILSSDSAHGQTTRAPAARRYRLSH